MGVDAINKEQHIVRIRPSRGWTLLNLNEVWQYRDLLFTLAGRDVKLRYRQTALGATWVVLQPLLAAGIFSVVFGRVANLPSEGLPYFLFSYAGLLGWNAFSSTLSKASGSLLGNSNLVSKVYFPRLILPLSTLFSTLIDFGVSLVMIGVLMVVYGVAPHIGILLLPVWLAQLLLLAMGFGLFASALAVTYRDVQYTLPVFLQFALYICPVAYSVSVVPPDLRNLYLLNPLSGLLEAFRWSLLGVGIVSVGNLIYAAVVTLLIFLCGITAFRRMERRFADVI